MKVYLMAPSLRSSFFNSNLLGPSNETSREAEQSEEKLELEFKATDNSL